MSDQVTKTMLEVYSQDAEPTLFFSGFFRTPARNFYTSEKIEIDIERSDEDIAIVVQDLSTGYRMNEDEKYTNKEFAPPIFKEAVPLNSSDLLKRMPGQNPFQSPDFRANVITHMMGKMRKVERKIRRSIELQSSQVMQTGVVTLIDKDGNALYTIDYKPKATHFPTSGTAWSSATGAQKLSDLNDLTEVIRNDGLSAPDQIIMGVDAFENFIQDSAVQARFDVRRADLGTISPMQMRGEGGIYRGTLELGNYKFDVWTYGGRYKHPQTGVKTQYMDPAKVCIRSSSARMDATFGAIPNIGKALGAQNRVNLPEMPSRFSLAGAGIDLHTNVWLTPDGEQLMGGIGTRPLMIPTAIDTFGCLDTGL